MPAHPGLPSHRSHLQRLVQGRDPLRATAMLTLAAAAVLLPVSLGLWLLVGGGSPWLIAGVALLCVAVTAPLLAWPLLRLTAELESQRARLDILATRDELTGVHNRRHLLVLTEREWALCRRYDMGAAVLMIDVDRFKSINDRHGHLAGDLMLREVTRAIGDTLRQPDLFGRFGGEEFIVFLPHADPLGALDAAERIRQCVAKLSFVWRDATVRATVSVGVAVLDPAHDSLAALINDADLALYAAKEAGRNCVRTLPSQPRRSGEVRPVVLR